MIKYNVGIILLSLISFVSIAQDEECTIGVACGKATSDGRALLWKTRDYASSPNNEVKYNTSYTYKFICVANAGTSTYAWMGVNEHGFAIVNSNSTDLTDNGSGPSNGAFMRNALGNCRTVTEFQALLDKTNNSGRSTHANFAVIDTIGAAAIFETSGTSYWRYNAGETSKGYIVRTNFAKNGGGTAGTQRYDRSNVLIDNFISGDSLNYKSILRYQMRDFVDTNGEDKAPIPYAGTWEGNAYGYIGTNLSICRYSSVSATVIHGTTPNEPAGFSTMWNLLGNPAVTIAVPYWPVCETPGIADGTVSAKLCDIALDIKDDLFDLASSGQYVDTYKLRNAEGGGLWAYTFPYEDKNFSYVDSLMEEWGHESLPTQDMHSTEENIALSTYKYLLYLYNYRSYLSTDIKEIILNKESNLLVCPNPFNETLKIRCCDKIVNITICSLTGEIVLSKKGAGKTLQLNTNSIGMLRGIYFLKVKTENNIFNNTIVKY